jgi:hypothetical protein
MYKINNAKELFNALDPITSNLRELSTKIPNRSELNKITTCHNWHAYYHKKDRRVQLKYVKRRDRVYGTPVSFLGAGYRGVPEFKTLHGDWPSCLRFFVVILGLPRKKPG